MDKEESSRLRKASKNNIARRSAMRQASRRSHEPDEESNNEPLIEGIPLSEFQKANPHYFFRPLPTAKPNTTDGNHVA